MIRVVFSKDAVVLSVNQKAHSLLTVLQCLLILYNLFIKVNDHRKSIPIPSSILYMS